MFGVTAKGNSVAVHVHNFTAYFYAHVTEPVELTPADIEEFRRKLASTTGNSSAVVQIDQVEKQSVMHYQEKMQKFLKIYVQHPKYVA